MTGKLSFNFHVTVRHNYSRAVRGEACKANIVSGFDSRSWVLDFIKWLICEKFIRKVRPSMTPNLVVGLQLRIILDRCIK